MNKINAKKIFQRFQKHDPHPTTELIYHTPFELLVAVILSAQATDKSVNKSTHELFKVANTPTQIINMGIEKLMSYIKNIGLYRTKGPRLIETSKILNEKHQGQVPNNREDLEALPGVGRKTANVILNTIFGEPTLAVDTHIFRVANRTKLGPGNTPLTVEKALLRIIPDQYLLNAHHWLVLHGRYICIARKPKCKTCFIKDLCEYEHKNLD